MIGTGRPFVMEMQSPKKRTFDLKELENAINASANPRVGVVLESWSDKKTVDIICKSVGYSQRTAAFFIGESEGFFCEQPPKAVIANIAVL